MRPALYKCPNHLHCTIGYHGDDVEISGNMPAVCPECGTALRPITKPRTALVPTIVSFISIACVAVGIWLAWPGAVKLWKKITTPPAPTLKK